MQNTLLRLFASITLCVALAFPTFAQPIINLEEITFSANLAETEIRRSGASVSVLDRADIEASGATQLTEVLSSLPGVSVISDGGLGASSSFRLRGAESRHVAVYIDGIRVDDPTGTSVSTDIGQISLFDVERLELLSGSQSALYGGSAVAGVINITTRRAEQDGVSQSAFVEGGSHSTIAAGYSMAYRDDRLEAALSLSHRRTKGFSAYEGIPGSATYEPDAAADGYEATRLSFSSKYQATDILTLGVSGFHQISRSEYDPWGTDEDGIERFMPNDDAEIRWRQSGLRLSGTFDLGTTQHTLAASGFWIKRDVEERGVQVVQFTGRRASLEYSGLAQMGSDLSLGWGADLTQESVRSNSIPDSRATRNLGAYGQILWAPTEALDLSATARVDRHSTFGTFATGRLSGAYQFSDSITLRAAVARGFRAPALDELYGQYPELQFTGNSSLTPERSNSAEVGVDLRFAGSAQVSATVFWLNTENRIEFDRCKPVDPDNWDFSCVGDTLNTLNNFSGTSRRHGVELSASIPVHEQITLSGNYTYTNARKPDQTRIERVARHTANLAVNGQINEDTRYSLSVQHVAGRPTVWGTDWKDYTVANAAIRYRVTNQADLYLRVENLFDRNYQVNPGYKTSGRAFYLGVASRF